MKKICNMTVRLTQEELDSITAKAKSTGLSRSAYCRAVLKGIKVEEGHTSVLGRLYQKLTQTGGRLNALLASERLQSDHLDEEIRETIAEIREAVQVMVRIYAVER